MSFCNLRDAKKRLDLAIAGSVVYAPGGVMER
ncbi:protein of unknown function [Streptantibioticus cattleyicolor NRRL 8057 = DSM 46488]|nr:protein of unknown function [Streptantibioticus cattleyicolor NRRL 8057 = DSM 46488]